MEVAPLCGCDHCLGWYPGVEKMKTRSFIIFFFMTGCAMSSWLELCGLESPPWWTVPQGVLWPWLPTMMNCTSTSSCCTEISPPFLSCFCHGILSAQEKSSQIDTIKRHKQKHYAKEPGEAAVYNLTPKSKNLKLSTPIKFSGRSSFGFYSFCLEKTRTIWV